MYNTRPLAWPTGGYLAVSVEHAASVAAVHPGAVIATEPQGGNAPGLGPLGAGPAGVGDAVFVPFSTLQQGASQVAAPMPVSPPGRLAPAVNGSLGSHLSPLNVASIHSAPHDLNRQPAAPPVHVALSVPSRVVASRPPAAAFEASDGGAGD